MNNSDIPSDGEPAVAPPVSSGPFPTFRALPGRVRRSAGEFWFPAFRALPGRARRGVEKFAKPVLALLLCWAVVHTAAGIYGSVLLNREIAYIRRAGEPLTLEEAGPQEPPAGQNAAPLYVAAAKALTVTSQERLLFSHNENAKMPERREAVAILARNHKALVLLRQAGARPACRFSYDFRGMPYSTRMPYYEMLRRLSKLMALEALREARAGDAEAALRDVRTLFVMGRHLHGEPFVIGFLNSAVLTRRADETLAQVLELTPVSARQAREFLASLPAANWTEAFQQALQGERASGVSLYEYLQANPYMWSGLMGAEGEGPLWRAVPMRLLRTPLLKFDEALFLRSWRRVGSGISGPLEIPVPPATLAQAEKGFDAVPRWAMVTRMVLPNFSRTRQTQDAAEVWKRAREIALALAVFHGVHHRYPPTLREAEKLWGHPFAMDPYGRPLKAAAAGPGPFRYQRRGGSFLLYSLGRNGKDDGGRNQQDNLLDKNGWDRDDMRWNSKRTRALVSVKP